MILAAPVVQVHRNPCLRVLSVCVSVHNSAAAAAGCGCCGGWEKNANSQLSA